MADLCLVDLRERPELADAASVWFSDKWGVPAEAYRACIEAYIGGETENGWFVCLDGNKIVAGLGVIDNDFHERTDLAPNICAVYTLPEYRGHGIAGKLLNTAVDKLRSKGIMPVYLVTDHIGFYERYGWEFMCMVKEAGSEHCTRMYVHY